MADHDIGDVLVTDDAGGLAGILTDRDLAVRVLATNLDPDECNAGEVASTTLVTVDADDSIDRVIDVARKEAVRRVVVLEDRSPIGIISLGDLAIARDPNSVLADISADPADTM
jgi:CBS domain-containing protein